MLLIQLYPAIPVIWWGILLQELGRESPVPPSSLHGGEGSSFLGSIPSDDMAYSKSVMDIKPGDSAVVVQYQFGEYTDTWLVEHFIAWSHICSGFTGKVSILTHFPFEPGWKDYFLLDQEMEDFECGLDSVLWDSINTTQRDVSLDEADAVSSSVSLGFLYLVITVSDTSRLQLVPSIKSHKLRCQARALLSPLQQAGKMSGKFITFLVIQGHLDSRLLCH